MAVVVLSRIRGVTDRSTKGLFLIFTLLCLVCFASSLMEKDQLVNSFLLNLSLLLKIISYLFTSTGSLGHNKPDMFYCWVGFYSTIESLTFLHQHKCDCI